MFTSGCIPVAARANVVIHGSILVGGTDDNTNIKQALTPMLCESATLTALSAVDATWQTMLNDDIDTLFDPEAANVLFITETTNSVQTRTFAEIVEDVAAYTTARRAAHPEWRIVLITTMPRTQWPDDTEDIDARNALITSVDEHFVRDCASAGLDDCVSVKHCNSPFCTCDPSVWSGHLPNMVGYTLVAEQCCHALRRFVHM